MPDILNLQQNDSLTVGLAQIAPVWLQREQTLEKMLAYAERAADEECELVAFSEALLPGYPFWIERTDGARFNSEIQKEIHAHYMSQAIQIEAGHLDPVCRLADEKNMAVMLGCIERPADRGGHSLYCTLVYIDAGGAIKTVHRKLMPTHEERLTWSPGDGHGLRTHPLGAFTVGGLNCWENWMPLARASLYAQGEDLHVALWPGSDRLTADITRFIALESRSYVLSVGGLMRRADIPSGTPQAQLIRERSEAMLANGGSCLAGPDGQWVIAPAVEKETLLVAVVEHQRVRRERQNFDPAGHYSRPDVTRLEINRSRQSTIDIVGDAVHDQP